MNFAAPLCPSGKRAWPDAAEARKALVLIQREGRSFAGKGGKTVKRVYQCPVCHLWHLTARKGK